MKAHAEQLALRRRMLVAECAAQRADLARQVQPLAHTMSSVNIGMRILDRIRKNPGWLAALAVGLMAVTPRRLSAFFRLGSNGLRVWRQVQPWLLRPPADAELAHDAGAPEVTHRAIARPSLHDERIARIREQL